MLKIRTLFKKDPTFCISFIAAAISCIFVVPDKEYVGYLDLRTLALLYCLMVVVAGLRCAGVFSVMSDALCRRVSSPRQLAMLLVLLCFFSAMLVTNDVALLTFVPFAVAVLGLAHQERQLIWVVVLQTVAANLGSMLTPVGNPQNLFLYSYYGMSAGDFFRITLPVWGISLVLVILLCIPVSGTHISVTLGEPPRLDKPRFAVYAVLFAVCLCVVFRLISWQTLLLVVAAVLAFYDRKRLLSADFMLLLTFVCFFVFSGNLARIPSIDSALKGLLNGRELLVGAGLSQVISNVPAALLLSGFTEEAGRLLLGVDIGGLGTPVASLASLISLKLYSHAESSDTKKYLAVFLPLNLALLAVLLIIAELMM